LAQTRLSYRNMRYHSTRGGASGTTFATAIQTGYAPDGGLFVPETLPQIDLHELESWRNLDFPSLAEALLRKFIGHAELSQADLHSIIQGCYEDFAQVEKVPVRRLGSFYVAELFHGPTYCFKDLGQQPLIRLLAHFAKKNRTNHTLLVSTTGDTGPAAMQAVSDANTSNIRMICFYPEGQISNLQRRQMTTLKSANAEVVAFQGGGDDMDLPLKRMAADAEFAKKFGLCGINSYNIARPLAQMPHYFWTYFRVLDQLTLTVGAPIDMVIPTGAMGNIAAGTLSRLCGLPIRHLVAGVNANDIVDRAFRMGEFHRSDAMEKTLSDAINIQVPYNFERLLYYACGEDTSQVRKWMEQMDATGKLTLPAELLSKLQDKYRSRRVDDPEILTTIQSCFQDHGYLIDPNTAVAVAAAQALYPDHAAGVATTASQLPVAILATASPCKFQETVMKAIGSDKWQEYQQGAEFPVGALNVLVAPERPPATLKALPDQDLKVTQGAWEATVRKAVESGSIRSKL